MQLVEREEDVPAFESEADEAEFWGTHTLSDAALAAFGERPPWMGRLKRTPAEMWVQLEPQTVRRLQMVASKQGQDLHQLLGRLISERLAEEERRVGIGSG
jgi:hypothetical protein